MKTTMKIHLKKSKDPPEPKGLDAHAGAIGE